FIAAPPYLITTVRPTKRCIHGSASMSTRALSMAAWTTRTVPPSRAGRSGAALLGLAARLGDLLDRLDQRTVEERVADRRRQHGREQRAGARRKHAVPAARAPVAREQAAHAQGAPAEAQRQQPERAR